MHSRSRCWSMRDGTSRRVCKQPLTQAGYPTYTKARWGERSLMICGLPESGWTNLRSAITWLLRVQARAAQGGKSCGGSADKSRGGERTRTRVRASGSKRRAWILPDCEGNQRQVGGVSRFTVRHRAPHSRYHTEEGHEDSDESLARCVEE
jgi:hypothetical protein